MTDDALTTAVLHHLDVIRRTHVIVRTKGDWVAYPRGYRRPWDGWRSITMMMAENPDRVAVRPIIRSAVNDPHPATVGVPNVIPAHWGRV